MSYVSASVNSKTSMSICAIQAQGVGKKSSSNFSRFPITGAPSKLHAQLVTKIRHMANSATCGLFTHNCELAPKPRGAAPSTCCQQAASIEPTIQNIYKRADESTVIMPGMRYDSPACTLGRALPCLYITLPQHQPTQSKQVTLDLTLSRLTVASHNQSQQLVCMTMPSAGRRAACCSCICSQHSHPTSSARQAAKSRQRLAPRSGKSAWTVSVLSVSAVVALMQPLAAWLLPWLLLVLLLRVHQRVPA